MVVCLYFDYKKQEENQLIQLLHQISIPYNFFSMRTLLLFQCNFTEAHSKSFFIKINIINM